MIRPIFWASEKDFCAWTRTLVPGLESQAWDTESGVNNALVTQPGLIGITKLTFV